MPKIIVSSQVQDPAKWEAGFRAHADLFRSYSIQKPIHFALSGNEATICFEPENLETWKRPAGRRVHHPPRRTTGGSAAQARRPFAAVRMKLHNVPVDGPYAIHRPRTARRASNISHRRTPLFILCLLKNLRGAQWPTP